MAGIFELFHEGDLSFGFRLKAPDGTVVAVSGQFRDKASAVEGIRVVRECAGMGLITDLCPPSPVEGGSREPDRVSKVDKGPGYLRTREIHRLEKFWRALASSSPKSSVT
ncbi:MULTISPECIES: YegP family protein [unclassified Arthrobacter]|uniref:YegP family protein n=1 Tax=unclassified Arthrobacter TaxID=235627 RepID=UPI0027D7D447|nr:MULTISPECIES: YegP family protein [unclassified Arthrobacter]